ncbi:hypothetical protein GCM10025860_25960 [Methanobacterium ferruginis]|nr:hypothetical protein GCM10025860_25960 [Methanobacterium ferruginis]
MVKTKTAININKSKNLILFSFNNFLKDSFLFSIKFRLFLIFWKIYAKNPKKITKTTPIA